MIKVFFDGSCEPNPGGIVRYGAVIYRHDKVIYEIAKNINLPSDISTNNTAEYCGLISSLKYLISNELTDEEIYVFGDSKLVINQMKFLLEINSGKYEKYAYLARKLLLEFSDIYFEWIPKENNYHADMLSRRVV